MTLDGEALVEVARAVAFLSHKGQQDKGGNPYIGHPRRVAQRVSGTISVAIAWLHDVVEDSDITIDDLREIGFGSEVTGPVDALTRKPDQTPEDYYALIRVWSRAREVKLADIADNLDPVRLSLLDDATIARLTRKYAKARTLLGVSS